MTKAFNKILNTLYVSYYRLDRLQDFVFSRRQQREDVAVETAALATDPSAPGHLLRLGSIANKRAKLALDGKMKAC